MELNSNHLGKLRGRGVTKSHGVNTRIGQTMVKLRNWLGVGVLMGLSLGGCSLKPTDSSLALPVAKQYPQQPAPKRGAQTSQIAAIEWRDYFADPYLRKLLNLAFQQNRELKIAALRVEEAQANYGIQRSPLFPKIDASGGGSRGQYQVGSEATSGVRENYHIGVGVVAWELDFWGKFRNLKGLALESFLASESASEAVKISLVAQVTEQYLALRELDARMMLISRLIANYQHSLQLQRQRWQVGAISQLDLAGLERGLAEAQLLFSQLQQARAGQEHALVLLVGGELPAWSSKSSFDSHTIFHQVRVGLPSELLMCRPDIVAAEHQLKAAGANIGVARAAFFPSVTLTGVWGRLSNEFRDLWGSDGGSWVVSPRITLPIFDGGRNLARLKVAKVQQQTALMNYEKVIQVAFREVSDALTGHGEALRQLAIYQRKMAVEQQQVRLLELRYRSGSASQLDLLGAQRDLLIAEQQLIQAQRTLAASRVRLYLSLGGGAQRLSPDIFASSPQSAGAVGK